MTLTKMQKCCSAFVQKLLLAPGHPNDGEIRECSCGQKIEHVCDEAEGCWWGFALPPEEGK